MARLRRAARAESLGRAAQAGWYLFALVVLVPWRPDPPPLSNLGDIRIDVSYMLALPEIERQQLQFGPHIDFTYGPLGMFHASYVAASLVPVLLIVRATLAVVFAWASLRVLRYCAKGPTRWVVATAFVALALVTAHGRLEAFWLSFAILLATLALHHERERRIPSWPVVALTACAAFASLVKFSFTVVALIVVAAVTSHDAVRRRPPVVLAVYSGVFLAAWLAAGQHLANIPTWVSRSVGLSTTYSDAMAKGFLAPYTTADIILFVVAAVASLVALMSAREQWSSSRALLLAAFVMIVFVQSKHAWGGNQLGEAAATIFLLIAVSGTMLPSNKAARALPAAPRIALLAGAGAAAVLLVRTDAWTRSLVTHGESVTYTARQAVAAARAIGGGGEPDTMHYLDRVRTRVTELSGLSRLRGTVDAFPDLAGVPASLPNATYDPRPMFLSINAQTHTLLDADAHFYEGQGAPQTVLLSLFVYPALPYDRYPMSQDGPSWLRLLSHYDVRGETPDFEILSRAATVHYTLRHLGTHVLTLGKPLALPEADEGLVWAQVDIRPSRLGDVVRTAYKLPPVWLSVVQNGRSQRYRLVPELARDGFLLSPLVTTNADFRLLAQVRRGHDLSGAIGRVQAITIDTGSGPRWLFRSDMTLHLFRLRFSARPGALPPEIARLASLARIRTGMVAAAFPSDIERSGYHGAAILFAHAPSRSIVAVPADARRATLRYGVRSTAWTSPASATDGVAFRALALVDGRWVMLWRRLLDPVHRLADRRELAVTLQMPARASRLALETRPGPQGDNTSDHSYWAGLTFANGASRQTPSRRTSSAGATRTPPAINRQYAGK